MGCTSSAPNMVAANPNATEKISEFSEEDTDQSIKEDDDIISAEEENGKNEIKVLPSCDTLADPIQLDSNNKSMIDSSNLDLEKDILDENNVTKNVNENEAKEIPTTVLVEENIITEEKISSLEDVVEKVVELFNVENLTKNTAVADSVPNNTQIVPEKVDQADNSLEKEKEEPEQLSDQPEEPGEETSEAKEEVLEEATSPSQSTSSRATRWEALADIAAELPPSLTVDPVTGQIYALSK